jgi:hypothetical protein
VSLFPFALLTKCDVDHISHDGDSFLGSACQYYRDEFASGTGLDRRLVRGGCFTDWIDQRARWIAHRSL